MTRVRVVDRSATLDWAPLEAEAGTTAPVGGTLLGSAGWGAVLATLGDVWIGRQPAGARRVLLLIVRRGPLRVGLLGFPVTPAWLAPWGSVAAAAIDPGRLALPCRVDLLRLNGSLLDAGPAAAAPPGAILQPETTIADLSAWPGRGAKRQAKDLAAARRHGLVLADAPADSAAVLHAIYAETVQRWRGAMRYGPAYFAALLALARRDAAVRVRAAYAPDGALAGFAAGLRDGARGYYLHGGYEPAYRSSGVSDLLLEDLLRWAAAAGAREVSLMASPVAQVGLARFKQKWGEQDGQWITRDVARTAVGQALAWYLRRRALRAAGA